MTLTQKEIQINLLLSILKELNDSQSKLAANFVSNTQVLLARPNWSEYNSITTRYELEKEMLSKGQVIINAELKTIFKSMSK